MQLRLLPWDYGVRNLFRRPSRSALTLTGLTTVVLLILVVVGFIRGLERSLAVSGDPSVVLVYSMNAGENIENSSIAGRTAALISASLEGIQSRYGAKHVSPELYLGTRIGVGEGTSTALGIVRGVTPKAPLVRRQVQMIEGEWPGPGEMLVGKLAHAKLGCSAEDLAIGQTVMMENKPWRVCGTFSAGGAAYESEIWCDLSALQQATKRQDLTLVAVGMAPGASRSAAPGASISDVEMFCKERIDLELQAASETSYYAALQVHYKPVRMLAWTVVVLVAGSGIFAGLNTMYGAVVGRVRELAMLQAIGFRRRALLLSLVQEATLLGAAASLLASLIALTLLNGAAVRFTMGAFTLHVDSVAIMIACGTGLAIAGLGAIPPALKAMQMSVVEGIKAV